MYPIPIQAINKRTLRGRLGKNIDTTGILDCWMAFCCDRVKQHLTTLANEIIEEYYSDDEDYTQVSPLIFDHGKNVTYITDEFSDMLLEHVDFNYNRVWDVEELWDKEEKQRSHGNGIGSKILKIPPTKELVYVHHNSLFHSIL